MDDWEYSEDDCPKCNAQLAYRRCDAMGCDGGVCESDDPFFPESEPCDECRGTGFQEWCRECGWDVTYGQFLSSQYEADWLAKQQILTTEEQPNV